MMNKLAPALCVLGLIAGCGKESGSGSTSGSSSAAEWKASTPKEFFDSVIAAIGRKDFDALWEKGMSKASRGEMEKLLKGMQDDAKKNKESWEGMKKELGVGDDWLTLEPKPAWIAIMKSEAEQDPEELKYVKDEVDAEKGKITISKKKLKKKKDTDPDPQPREDVWPVVKEDGLWKMDRR